MKTAKFIKDVSEYYRGNVNLYELTPAVTYKDTKKTKFVVCSTVNAMFSGPETYIFPSNKAGVVISWGELEGSRQGVTCDTDVLKGLGYTIKNT